MSAELNDRAAAMGLLLLNPEQLQAADPRPNQNKVFDLGKELGNLLLIPPPERTLSLVKILRAAGSARNATWSQLSSGSGVGRCPKRACTSAIDATFTAYLWAAAAEFRSFHTPTVRVVPVSPGTLPSRLNGAVLAPSTSARAWSSSTPFTMNHPSPTPPCRTPPMFDDISRAGGADAARRYL